MKKIILLLLLLVNTSLLFSQDQYDSLLNELSTKYPQEKTYIQTDKAYYSPGETIWFKAYVRADDPATQISTSMYAELLNENGKVLERKSMPILFKGGASSFQLPDTIKTSKLFIRAYTSWMLNFDSSLLYTKAVNILRPEPAIKKDIPAYYTLTLFPEGGDLVSGIDSRVAFKTNDENGKPFNVKGNIVDAQGKVLTEFSSTHNGMGYFNVTPDDGQSYKAVWKDITGKQHETALPPARSNAAVLSITGDKGLFKFTITRSANASDDMKEFVVIAQQQQHTVYAAKINLKTKTTVTAPIPVDSLPDGIMQVTIFNKAAVPVAERIVYIKSNDQYFITDLHLIEKNMIKKGRNVIQVDVGGSLKSNLSVSVTDADLDIRPVATENIYSQFLLSSDLKGSIYNPAYYFSSDEDSVMNQLDLVMMTNGWRRFNWQKLLSGNMPQIKYMPEAYLSIKGNMYGLNATQIKDKMITGFIQTSKQAESALFTAPVDKDGNFKIDQLYFFDTVRILYQINGDKDKRLTDMASFSFRNNLQASPLVNKQALSFINFAPQPPKALAAKTMEQSNAYRDLLSQQKIKVLETVSILSKKKSDEEKLNQQYTSGLFSSGNARVFDLENDPFALSSMSVLDYLRGKVAGLQITTGGMDGGAVSRRGSPTDVFLNEMPTDLLQVQTTPMSDVAMIKVFDPPFFGAFGGGAGGAIAVYTKKGGGRRSDAKGLNVATVQGYSSIKEFYSPDYSTDITSQPDFRTTLYWGPFLLMNPQNKRVTIPFYNNDNAKRIRVVIEGINELGQLTREEKIFE